MAEPPAALDSGLFSHDDCAGEIDRPPGGKHASTDCADCSGALGCSRVRAGRLPSRPITMVVAFPPGGVAELTGRPTAIAMERVLKQRIIIENRPGAAGATGNAYVANAKPDGYTLLMALSSISVIPEAERQQGNKPPYELNQLAPIALVSSDPVVLVVREEAPWKSVQDFISAAKQQPNKITYSSSGIFGALHIPFVMLEHATGT